jgi:uncharacterized membrane protein YfcA
MKLVGAYFFDRKEWETLSGLLVLIFLVAAICFFLFRCPGWLGLVVWRDGYVAVLCSLLGAPLGKFEWEAEEKWSLTHASMTIF